MLDRNSNIFFEEVSMLFASVFGDSCGDFLFLFFIAVWAMRMLFGSIDGDGVVKNAAKRGLLNVLIRCLK